MPGSHKAGGPDKVRKPIDPSGTKQDPEGLTCNEGQVEDLLSEGESTEAENGEEGGDNDPTRKKSVPL